MQDQRFAIYSRISRDRVGAGLGIERQQADCEALIQQLGGTVVATFSDNDISAYAGKHRPGYSALLSSIESGAVDAVVVWHQDRLLRRTIDLEHYIDVCQPRKVATYTVKAGYFDLTTPAGRATAKTLAAWASYEVETSTDRVKAAKLQAAQAGRPSGGNRAYGYAQNGLDIIEEEAKVVVEAIERFIGGESWRQIAFDFNSRGIPTAKGNKWSSINVRNVAVRPRNIAIRVHNDNQYPAQWPPLIDQDTWDELQLAIRRGQAIYGQRSYTRKHLLTGFIFCGLCGGRMKIINAQQRDGSYEPAFSCRKVDHRGDVVGCGKVKRKQAPVEELVKECLFYRLDTPDLESLLSHDSAMSAKLRQLLHDQEDQKLRVQEILAAYSSGDLTMNEWKTAKALSQKQLEKINRDIDRLVSSRAVATIPAGKTVLEAWQTAGIDWQRQLLDSVVDKVLIYPKQKGDGKARYKQWIFNPERVEIRWKA